MAWPALDGGERGIDGISCFIVTLHSGINNDYHFLLFKLNFFIAILFHNITLQKWITVLHTLVH